MVAWFVSKLCWSKRGLEMDLISLGFNCIHYCPHFHLHVRLTHQSHYHASAANQLCCSSKTKTHTWFVLIFVLNFTFYTVFCGYVLKHSGTLHSPHSDFSGILFGADYTAIWRAQQIITNGSHWERRREGLRLVVQTAHIAVQLGVVCSLPSAWSPPILYLLYTL